MPSLDTTPPIKRTDKRPDVLLLLPTFFSCRSARLLSRPDLGPRPRPPSPGRLGRRASGLGLLLAVQWPTSACCAHVVRHRPGRRTGCLALWLLTRTEECPGRRIVLHCYLHGCP